MSKIKNNFIRTDGEPKVLYCVGRTTHPGKKLTFPKYVLYTLHLDADEWEGKENGKGRMDKESK